MKTKSLKSALFAVALLCGTSLAEAETLTLIPFEFQANGRPLPAGAYAVRSLPGSAGVVMFVNHVTGQQAFAFAQATQDAAGKPALEVTVRATGQSRERGLASAARAAKAASLSLVVMK